MASTLYTYKDTALDYIKAIKVISAYTGFSFETVSVGAGEHSKFVNSKTPFERFPVLNVNGADVYCAGSIAKYIANSRADLTLNGANLTETAVVDQNISIIMTEVASRLAYIPRGSSEEKKNNVKAFLEFLKKFDAMLKSSTYLAGNTFTIADIFFTFVVAPAFTKYFGPDAREAIPSVTRLFLTVANQVKVAQVLGKVELFAENDFYVKPAPLPAVDAKPKKAEKTVNPCDALPKSEMKLDDVKRFYNLERPFSATFFSADNENNFWNVLDKEGYSIYTVSYKYPEDWSADYMASNQIVGFVNRCESVKKYAFAVLHLLEVGAGFDCKGVFLIRGTNGEGIQLLDESAAENEEYDFVKLDANSEADRKKFEAYACPADGKLDGHVINVTHQLK